MRLREKDGFKPYISSEHEIMSLKVTGGSFEHIILLKGNYFLKNRHKRTQYSKVFCVYLLP